MRRRHDDLTLGRFQIKIMGKEKGRGRRRGRRREGRGRGMIFILHRFRELSQKSAHPNGIVCGYVQILPGAGITINT